VSDPARYAFTFDPGSPYAKAIGLLEAHGPGSGTIVDIGCGFGPAAEPLSERGYRYVGFDVEPAGVEDLRRRGFSAEVVDVSDPRSLVAELEAVAGRAPVAGVFALDVLEHLVDPWTLAAAVAGWLAAHDGAVLVWSIPNVAHLDVAAKLLAGRFELTDTGLLDRTHLRFFTAASVANLAEGAGLVEVGADDVLLGESDQHWPALHPFLRSEAPTSAVLRWLRSRADPTGSTNQFVRCYRPAPCAASAAPSAGPSARAVFVVEAAGSPDGWPRALDPRPLSSLATEPSDLRAALAGLRAPWWAVPIGEPNPAVLAEVARRVASEAEPRAAGVTLVAPEVPRRRLPWPLAFGEPSALPRGSVLLVERELVAELGLPVAEAEVSLALWRLVFECAVLAGLDEAVVTAGPASSTPTPSTPEGWSFHEAPHDLLRALVATSPVLLPPGDAQSLLTLADSAGPGQPPQPAPIRRRSALERWLSRSAPGAR